jgi:DNA-binding MarR family transcriptional regulator
MGSNTILAAELGPPLVAIRKLVRTLRTSASTVERDTGLSSAQLFVLQMLNEAPANSVNDLAARSMTDQSSVSVVVARLEAKRLVTRLPSRADARRTTVSITPAGRMLIEGAPATVQGRLIAALLQLTPETRAQLTTLIETLTDHLGAASDAASFLFEDDATGAH